MKSQKEDLHRNRLIIIMMESKTARTLDDCMCVVCVALILLLDGCVLL